MWQMVTSCKLSPVKFYNFVVNQYPHLKSQQILSTSLMYLNALLNNYMVPSMVADCKQKMFDVLMTVLQNVEDNSLKTPIVDNMMNFITSPEQVALARLWADKKQIHPAGEPDKTIYDLAKNNLFSICKVLFKSPHMTTDEKNELLSKVVGDDKSDLAKNLKLQCETSIPDAAVKEKAWNEIVNPNSTLSMKEREAMMSGFYARSQQELTRPYADKYYEALKDFNQHHNYRYQESFISGMRPTMEILDSHIVKLVTIKLNVPDTNSAYLKQLEENIELLIRCKRLRELAAQD